MKTTENQSKKYYYPLRDAENPKKVSLIEITEEQYRALYPEIWATQSRERNHGRCVCPKKYNWKCDANCDLCEYRAMGDKVYLDEPAPDGNTDWYVFVTLPEVFASMPASALWSSLFFLLLSVAALTSTISIAEVSVAFISDRFKTSRLKSCLIVLLPLFVLSSVCSLSQGQWSGYTIFGMTIFDFLDNLATNIMLPLGSLGLCVYLGWFAPQHCPLVKLQAFHPLLQF